MTIHVRAAVLIRRPRAVVAQYMFDARNDADWTTGVVPCRPLTNGALRPGSRVERVTNFLGREFTYQYCVTARDGDRVVDLRVDEPFPMRIRYELCEEDGSTLASIKANGEAGRFFRIAGPLLALIVRRNIARDLASLKARLENGAG